MGDDRDDVPEAVGADGGRSTGAGEVGDAVLARPQRLPWDADASPALAQGLGLVCLFVAVAAVTGAVLKWEGGLLDLLVVIQVVVFLRMAVYFLGLARRGRRGRG
jgi:hypothetical protein